MKCEEVYLHICDNLDQDLNSPRCKLIKKHLASCPDCRAYLDSLKTTISLYKAMPIPSVSRPAHRKLHTTIRTLASRDRKRRGRTTRPRSA